MLPGATHVNEFWQDVSGGNSKLDFLTRCDPAGTKMRVAGEIRDFDHRKFLPDLEEKFARRYTRETLATMSAVEEARNDAGLDRQRIDPARVSLIASSSRGPVEWITTALGDGTDDTDHFSDSGAMLRGMPGSSAALAAIYSGVQGLVTTLSSACVGGQHAVALAADLIRAGSADAAIVVGYEFPLTSLVLRSFTTMGEGVLSSEDAHPKRAVRPYTRDREGFVFGEGAVALVLEGERSVESRGACAYARVLSHRALNEASHPFGMDMSGEVTAGVVSEALAQAGRAPHEVDYFCGHGTGTPKNDLAESRMLGVLYGDRRTSWPPISSVKPVYGHLLGAAGILNAASTALTLHHQCLCATANYAEAVPDPECDHDHVGEGPRDADVDLAVSLTFAIGSQTSALVMCAA